MRALLLVAAVLLPDVVWSGEVGVPVVKKTSYTVQRLPTDHVFPSIFARESQEKNGLVWLDNRRILFVGFFPNRTKTKGMYIWEIIANTVSEYGREVNFCHADGYVVAYGVAQERNDPEYSALTPIRRGMLGHESEVVCDSKTGKGCLGLLNMSCRPRAYLNNPQPIGPKWRTTFALRDGDGVLLAPAGSDEERKGKTGILLNKHFPEGKVMPFSRVPIMGAAYSEYQRRYALTPWWPADEPSRTSSSWPQGRPQPVYLMDAENGNVDVIDVPWRAEWTTILLALPTRAGLVFMGGGGHSNQWGGLFLYDNNREVWPLDRGKVETFAVSPDGCRVAYAIINDFGKIKNVRFNSIKSINFCEGGQVNGRH